MPAQTLSFDTRASARPLRAAAGRLVRQAAGTALAFGALAGSAQAAFLYTFQFDALSARFGATSISYLSDSIATFGDVLSYDSGSVNGCAPSEITYFADSQAFGTGVATIPLPCGDSTGPEVDGFQFRPDLLPLTVGVYGSTNGAGRVFFDGTDNGNVRYTNGILTIAALGAAVPEPATWGLVALSLAALWSVRRHQRPAAAAAISPRA